MQRNRITVKSKSKKKNAWNSGLLKKEEEEEEDEGQNWDFGWLRRRCQERSTAMRLFC